MASETVYPLLPLFLTQVLGAGAMSLGIIEGAAEAANSVLKIVSGWLADRMALAEEAGARRLRHRVGRPAAHRPGHGMAAGARDPILGSAGQRDSRRAARRDARDFAPRAARGRVFGFHRAMDHAGAVTGPLLATAFLFFYPGNYRTLFFLTIIPGIIVILFILRVPERGQTGVRPGSDRGQTPSQKLPSPRSARCVRESSGAASIWRWW